MSGEQTAKEKLRQLCLTRRRALDVQMRARLSAEICRRFLAGVELPKGSVVAGYFPAGAEVDIMPILQALALRGHPLALPCSAGNALPPLFRRWKEGAAMTRGLQGIPEPDATALLAAPDVILTPIVGFDRRGWRLGHGAGYYDRAIFAARLRGPVLAIGFAYAAQECEAIPAEAHDAAMDMIVTEDAILRMG